MTVFRGDHEADPMPGSNEQISQSAAFRKPEETKATFTGQDAGLSQSLADLRKGYENAAHVQTEESRQAAISRAMVDAKISENLPRTSVQIVGERTDHSLAGDSRQVPSSDPAWSMPTAKLREQLELTEQLYGKAGALNSLLQSHSPADAQRAVELEDRLRWSMGETAPAPPPLEQPQEQQQQPSPQRPQTFENGEVYQLTTLPDGNLEVQLITGERFVGDPITVTQNIAKAKVSTTRWGQEWKQKAQAQPQSQNGNGQGPGEGPPSAILPASGVQYDEYGAPILEMGQAAVPDQTFAQLNNMAVALGYTDAAEMVNDQLALRARTEQIGQELQAEREDRQNKETAAIFLAQHPDFPNDERSINALGQIIERNNLQWTSENMSLAHAAAVRDGIYQPLSQEAQQEAVGLAVPHLRPVPPPMINRSSPESAFRTEDVHSMPLAELRRLAIAQELDGKGSSPNYR